MKFQRVNVVGASGMGKSIFCETLAEKTGFPHIQLDALFWMQNWKFKDEETFLSQLEKSLEPPNWILDGNYQRTAPIKWKHIDTVIWLDYSFSLNVYRAVKRAITRAMTQEEIWPDTNCRESFQRSFFSRDSVVLWTIKTHHQVKREYEQIINDDQFQHINFIRLKSPKEAQAFLDQL